MDDIPSIACTPVGEVGSDVPDRMRRGRGRPCDGRHGPACSQTSSVRTSLVIVIVSILSLTLGLALQAIEWRTIDVANRQREQVRDALMMAGRDAQAPTQMSPDVGRAGAPDSASPSSSMRPGRGDPDDLERLDQQLADIEGSALAAMRRTAATALAVGVVAGIIAAGLLHALDRQRRRRASRRTRRLTRDALRLHESQGLRLARELHDGACQVLLSTRWLLERALLPSVARAEPAGPVIGEALARLDRAHREVREVSSELYPPRLDSLGLTAALEAMAGDADGQGGARVRFSSNAGELAFDLPMAAVLFRIGQEALSNALRHARARTIVVSFTASPQRVSLSVVDDGRGFDRSALPRSTRAGPSGLRLMRDRMQMLGGGFRLRTDAGRGTRVSVALPTRLVLRRRQRPGYGRPDPAGALRHRPDPAGAIGHRPDPPGAIGRRPVPAGRRAGRR